MTLYGGNVTLAEIRKFYGTYQKNLNTLSAAKCNPMILRSRNIRQMRIFARVPRGGCVKYNKCYTYVQTLNKNMCLLVVTIGIAHLRTV